MSFSLLLLNFKYISVKIIILFIMYVTFKLFSYLQIFIYKISPLFYYSYFTNFTHNISQILIYLLYNIHCKWRLIYNTQFKLISCIWGGFVYLFTIIKKKLMKVFHNSHPQSRSCKSFFIVSSIQKKYFYYFNCFAFSFPSSVFRSSISYCGL